MVTWSSLAYTLICFLLKYVSVKSLKTTFRQAAVSKD